MRRAFAIALTSAAIFGPQGSAAPAGESGRSASLATRAVAQAEAVGGVVLANGTTVRRTVTGFADRAKLGRMTTDARFRIASVTKTFVATVVLQLVGEGRLRLDDSVESLLPGRVIGGDSLTVRSSSDIEVASVSKPYRPIDDRYGLGFMVYGTRCGAVVGHRGRIDVYRTFVLGTAVGRRSAVVMLNVGRIDDARAVRLNRLIFTELCASTPVTRR